MRLLITFIVLSIINVIFSTIRSIATIKGGKAIASLMNGGYFAFYNIMLIYTVAEFPMWQKCVITFVCNVIGVWIVKFVEEKLTKDKLWKIELTVKIEHLNALQRVLLSAKIPFNSVATDDGIYVIFNVYCATQSQSLAVKEIVKNFEAKYFVSESKIL